MMRVAGVTFKNEKEDGGASRQEILRNLAMAGRAIITVDLIETTFGPNEEYAVKCLEHSTRQMIGWIPKTELANVKHSQMTGFIDHSKVGYSVRLDNQKAPSQRQYYAVKHICEKNGIAMPAYDIRAYVTVFAMEEQ